MVCQHEMCFWFWSAFICSSHPIVELTTIAQSTCDLSFPFLSLHPPEKWHTIQFQKPNPTWPTFVALSPRTRLNLSFLFLCTSSVCTWKQWLVCWHNGTAQYAATVRCVQEITRKFSLKLDESAWVLPNWLISCTGRSRQDKREILLIAWIVSLCRVVKSLFQKLRNFQLFRGVCWATAIESKRKAQHRSKRA